MERKFFFWTTFLIQLVFLSATIDMVHAKSSEKGQHQHKNSVYGVSETRRMDSIYESLPNYQQLSEIILKAQSSQLDEILQQLYTYSDKMRCAQKVLYFNEMIGMIQVGLTKINIELKQLNSTHESTKSQMFRLYSELSGLQKHAEQIGIFQVNDQLGQTLVQLSDSHEYYHEIQKQIDPLKSKIRNYEEIIGNYTEKANIKRKVISKNTVLLFDLDNSIESLEGQLALLRIRRSILTDQIQKNRKIVSEYEGRIQQSRESIKGIENRISKIIDKLDKVKGNSLNLKIDIELLEDRADKYQQDAILLEIYQNKRKIEIEEAKLKRRSFLTKWMGYMTKKLSILKQQNKEYYYYCFDEYVDGKYGQSYYGYEVKGIRLPAYLANIYSYSVSLPSSQGLDKHLNFIDIFGQRWSQDYGYPFYEKQFRQNNLFLAGSFGCLNPKNAISGNGIVMRVNSNFIQIKTMEDQYINLKLGACSRIETNGDEVKKGQTIYYKGILIEQTILELYIATCL